MIGHLGGVEFPLVASEFTDSFAPAEPARATMLGLFTAAINAELGEVWGIVTATLPGGHKLVGTDPVEDTLELAPTHQVMEQRKPSFPLLALHRTEAATWTDRSVGVRSRAQPWNLHYILGPLEVGASRKLLDACTVVAAVVDRCIEDRSHAAYMGGAPQFGTGGPLDTVKLTKTEGPGQSLYGGDEQSGAIYWAIVMTIDTTETGSATGLDGSTDDPILDGTTYDVGIGDGTGEVLPSVVQADTDTILL